MEAFIVSFFLVATAEIGDKTQLLALCLASRFRKPVPILLGILAATLANHLLAGLIGEWIGVEIPSHWLHILLALSFFAAAVWALIPDKLNDDCNGAISARGVFMATTIAFFIAEIGDKTQLATVALAAKYHLLTAVVAGTALGMMAANIPAVLFSNAIASKVPLTLVRIISGVLFAVLGVFELCTL